MPLSINCHAKRLQFLPAKDKPVICVAVLDTGEKVEVTSRIQLMCLRRVAHAWEDSKGNQLPFSTPARLLKESFGYHI
jgi:hypothetical protein